MKQQKTLDYSRPMDTLRALSVGKEAMFPIVKLASVRAMCTLLKTKEEGEWQTRIDHENKAIRVKRVKPAAKGKKK